MTEQKIKKIIFVLRIITIVSAVLTLAFMAALSLNIDSDEVLNFRIMIKCAAYILSACVFAPPFVIIFLRVKMKYLNADKRTGDLKNEMNRPERK